MDKMEYSKKITDYLQLIDKVIEEGFYDDTWESLGQFQIPLWYKNAKFGIFSHWGVYSVQAHSSEWYARNMYLKNHPLFQYHIDTYGPQKDFGYADFIPMFRAEKFDAREWMDLIKESGAKFFMPVAEHHDGFQMYDSEISDFNVVKMGPCRDVFMELKEEAKQQSITFCASSHRAENYWFMSGLREFDSGLEDIEYQEPYGFAVKLFEGGKMHETTHNIYSQGPNKEHLDDWLVRTCELVDKYQPKIVWFDWWIQNMAFKPYLKKFAAFYYNRGIEWGEEVAINYKEDAFARGTAVFDVERGQLADIRPDFWQTDTAVAKNSWCYSDNNVYKTSESLVCDLIDIVSKNGALLLNIGPKADGTIPDEDAAILRNIGKWLKVNGDSIYNTQYWKIFGEGPTKIVEGTFNDVLKGEYTCEDIRYTYKSPYVYANILKFPESRKSVLRAFRLRSKEFLGHIESVDVLGFDTTLTTTRTDVGLEIEFGEVLDTTYPVCVRIKID